MIAIEAHQTNEKLSTLKDALLSIKAAGADGFEGLLRHVLTNLTGIPFRLAASGLQGGMDGEAALQKDAVSFEAKRYSGDIHRNEVLAKIADLARNESAPDRLWVLGATTEISSQLASAVRQDGDQNAISTLILDWTAAPLPFLAVAVVAAGDKAIDFLVEHFDPKTGRKKYNRVDIAESFAFILRHPEFYSSLQALKADLNVSKLAAARALAMHKSWRSDSFGATDTARDRLGQALAVGAQSDLPPLRMTLREEVRSTLLSGRNVTLSGGEGQGKSWLAAQICLDYEGIALFASAERFDGVAPKDLNEFLINLLIDQTGDVPDEAIKRRWRHRLSAWQTMPPPSSVLVVVDGINQRQNLRWDRILNGLQDRLEAFGGRLVVTVRPQYWQKEVFPGLNFRSKVVDVPEWAPGERDQLLMHYGINLSWLDKATLKTLRNPRLLGVAIATLPRRRSVAWIGLTTDRLLMEHLRASQRENFETETFKELTRRLSDHAKQVLDRVRASLNEPPQNFEADSAAVIETRFFQTLPGPGDIYVLREEGLTLALGYTLVDQLWQAQRSDLKLAERMAHLIDPIQAIDRTADVVLASLMVCVLDPIRFDKTIFCSLLESFSSLQNLNDQRFEEFVEIVRHQPVELFGVLGGFSLERGKRINQDWFVHAAFEVADDSWPVVKATVHRWLHCYNKDATEQANRYPKHNDIEDAKRLQRRRDEIQSCLSSLSPFERTLLEQMTEVSGETGALFTLALQLLAGRPLADFADSFVALGLGLALDRDANGARKAFQQLTTFNSLDREASRAAFLNAIEPLRSSGTSKAGQWTVVRMLYATGDEVAAIEANDLAQKLRADWPRWEPPSPDQWRQAKVADPAAIRPVDMDDELKRFCAIDQEKILQTMHVGSEDRDYRNFLPVACRFEPIAAVETARRILSGVLTRTGFPLRQLIVNSEDHAPLLTRDLAIQLIARVTDTDMIDTLPKADQGISRMLLFNYAAIHLTPLEQLTCLTNKAFGCDYLLTVIPSLKPQSTATIISALQAALASYDEEAAFGTLVAALYGKTPVTPELEFLLLHCCDASLSKLRSVAFELAIRHDLKAIREKHFQSEWSSQASDEKTYESWFGSMLLIEACVKDELAIDDTLNRVSQRTWFAAADRVGDRLAKPLAEHFLRWLKGAVDAARNISPPAIDLTLSTTDPVPYSFISIEETDRKNERFPRERSIKEIFIDFNDDFNEKQDRLNSVADAFFKELDSSDARLFMQRITIDDLRRLNDTTPSLLPQILEILEQTADARFVWLKNLAFATANLVSKKEPDRAASLFERAIAAQGFVTYAVADDLTLEHEAIWSSGHSKAIHRMWRRRLLNSGNDAALAQEVLAAERFGASGFIRAFVEELALSPSTLDQAYSISTAGYSSQSAQLVDFIKEHMDKQGITGDAATHAIASHDAAQWAANWVGCMWDAQTPEEFWRCLLIAKTTIDARVSSQPKLGTPWAHYAPLFRTVRNAAIKEQNKAREKRFLGQETPDRIFVACAGT